MHSGSLRESVINYKGNLLIVALKPKYSEIFRSIDTGEEVEYRQAESEQFGNTFEYLRRKQTGYFVLIPGFVKS